MSAAPDPKQHDIFIAAGELRNQKGERLSTGSKNMDNLFGDIGGGIETGAITQFYGPPGSGKTQLCYTICAMLRSEYKAVYIDTESTFRPERIECISKARGLDPAKTLQNIQVAKPLVSSQQESCIESAISAISKPNSKIKLLIVDSMTSHYRVDYAGRSRLPEKQQRLNKYMHMLLRTAQTNGRIAVVLTNQMQSNPDNGILGDKSMPVGGHIMLYASTHVVHLRRLKLYNHQAELVISPCYPRRVIDFVVDQRGVVDDINDDDKQAHLRRRI
jgi:DNA repair protein RadA